MKTLEIHEKKIKVSKKIARQFLNAKYEQLLDCHVFGYVVGLYSPNNRTIILKSRNNYYKISLEYKNMGSYAGYSNGYGRGETILDVDNVDEWFIAYNNVAERAIEAGQLFF